jgi:hypothetical protein
MVFPGADPDQAFASVHPSDADRLDAVPDRSAEEARTDSGDPG